MSSALRKGWCPSALRPMASGDGLIVRLSVRDGIVTPALGQTLARLSRQHGNGLLDLSSRANLQLRGVTETTLPALQAELRTLGLLEADAAPPVARNILVSPLAGIDPQAVLDIGPCVQALRQRLEHDDALHRLSAKFGFVVDDGGALSVAGEKADVSFLAQHGASAPYFLVCLAGEPAGECAIHALADVGLRIAHAFLQLRDVVDQRMADHVRGNGIGVIAARAGLTKTAAKIAHDPSPRPIGAFRVGAHYALGPGIAFGRLDAAQLEKLAKIAEASRGALRLTPWRAILIVGAEPPDAAQLADAGLIFAEDDPLRAVAACPGAPRCASGTTPTQDDARRIAPLARQLKARGIAVHVSGCAKGCAHAAAAPVTFVGRDGRYDLVRHGAASDTAVATGFKGDQLPLVLQRLVAKADA
ncbi:MAG: precorrin-3B synthase [Pseudomonadota bacterium]